LQPARSLASEQEPGADADCQNAEESRHLAVVNEPRASRADLERANGRHASAAATTQALRLRSPVSVGRLVARDLLASRSEPASTTCSGSEPEGDLRDRNHGHVALPNGLMVDVADAEVTLEELRDRLDWCGSG